MLSVVQLESGAQVETSEGRDGLLTKFGKAVLDDRYLMPEESFRSCLREFRAILQIARSMHSGYMTI